MRIFSLALLCGVIIVATAATSAQANPIVWGSNTQIVGTADINTNGAPVWAYDFVGTGQTVNGVVFDAAPLAGTGDQAWGDLSLTGTTVGAHSPFLGSRLTGDTSYDDLLKPAMFDNGSGAGGTLSLTGLASGQPYELQLWSNDSRQLGAILGRTTTVQEGAGPLATILQNFGNDDNSIVTFGSHMTGSFTSDGSDVVLTLGSHESGYLFNAAQLRAIPEPTTLGLGLVSLCVGLLATRRRVA